MKKVHTLTLLKEFYPYIKETSFRLKLFTILTAGSEQPHWFNNQIRINSFFPPYPSQSFDRIVDIIKNQKRLPHTIDFAITSKCPFQCPHCSYGKRKTVDLSSNEILKIIGEIKELGTAILGITGGEPMTRGDLEQIIASCSPELSTILYTTGYDLTKKRAQALYDANVGSVFVGIDSVDPKVQDEVRRKKGTWELGIQALKICSETGIYTGINTIATREKIHNGELEKIYDLACSLDAGELGINYPVATGRWAGRTSHQLNQDELKLLIDIRKRLNKKKSGPIVTTPAVYETKDFMGCLTGYQCLFIDAAGEVCPCDFTPLSFGNVQEKPLKIIWEEMETHFPRPRTECLMRSIAQNIEGDSLPLPPSESKKMIPKLDEESLYPKIYRYTRKINK